MLNKLFFSMLLLLSGAAMSFSTTNDSKETIRVAKDGGGSLTVTNPSPGTAVLTWQFSQPSLVYNYTIEDVATHQVVRSGQTSGTSFTATNLPVGNYRFAVSNETIIVQDYDCICT